MRTRHVAVCTPSIAVLALAGCGGTSDFQPFETATAAVDGQNLVVTSPTDPVFTTGTATNAPPSGNQPDVCSNLGVQCVKITLTVQLPNGVWSKPGGVQVAIRWPTDDDA